MGAATLYAQRMFALRALLMTHRRFAAAIILCALAMKALVPVGYMVASAGNSITVTICSGMAGETEQVRIPMESRGERNKASVDSHAPCPLMSDAHGLAGTDPLLLAGALAFILLLGFAPVRAITAQRLLWLRPPLRGPPLSA
jgi:hypothetical protein